MQSKFEQVSLEEGTKVIHQQEAALGDYEVLYQIWCWDGITAESIVFASDDVSELSDIDLEKLVRQSPIVKSNSSVTLTRTAPEFTFVNFNFEL